MTKKRKDVPKGLCSWKAKMTALKTLGTRKRGRDVKDEGDEDEEMVDGDADDDGDDGGLPKSLVDGLEKLDVGEVKMVEVRGRRPRFLGSMDTVDTIERLMDRLASGDTGESDEDDVDVFEMSPLLPGHVFQ